MDTAPLTSAPNLTRRHWLLCSAAAASCLYLGAGSSYADSDNSGVHPADAIHQELSFNASPHRIYTALTNAAQFQKIESLSDAAQSLPIAAHPARIHAELGSPFALFGNYIVGRQIELVPDRRIVQAWRVESWAPGAYSIASFQLSPQGNGTKLVFDHTGFPAGTAQHLAAGWHAHYWNPLRQFLG